MDEPNLLKLKAEQLTRDGIKLSDKTNDIVALFMKGLYQFGESIVDKTESQENLTKNIECSKDCSYCCYAQVSLTPPEAIYIGDYLKTHFSFAHTDLLFKKINHNISLTHEKPIEERIGVWEETPCIFLSDGSCSIYPVRPFICRAWHSLSVSKCKIAFDSRDKEAEIDSYPYRNYILKTIREGMSDVCDEEHLDFKPVEITIAMKSVLHHPAAEKAWLDGKKLFSKQTQLLCL